MIYLILFGLRYESLLHLLGTKYFISANLPDDDDDDNDGLLDHEDMDDDGDGVLDGEDEDHPDYNDEL